MDGNPICLNDRLGLSTKEDDWHPEDDGNGGQKLVADPGDKNYVDKEFKAKELGFTQEMRDMGSCGGLEWAGVMKTYITGPGLWTDLKPGALIGFDRHSAIFVEYQIIGNKIYIVYWDEDGIHSTAGDKSSNDQKK